MATFPLLKTGAVAQYPATKTVRFNNQILRFLDGTDQRYRDALGPLHSWEISLEQLDEGEQTALDSFFLQNSGSFGDFAFTDPWDGTLYPSCSLANDGLAITSIAEMRGSISVKVIENRG